MTTTIMQARPPKVKQSGKGGLLFFGADEHLQSLSTALKKDNIEHIFDGYSVGVDLEFEKKVRMILARLEIRPKRYDLKL